jgi:hypothetical protein
MFQFGLAQLSLETPKVSKMESMCFLFARVPQLYCLVNAGSPLGMWASFSLSLLCSAGSHQIIDYVRLVNDSAFQQCESSLGFNLLQALHDGLDVVPAVTPAQLPLRPDLVRVCDWPFAMELIQRLGGNDLV